MTTTAPNATCLIKDCIFNEKTFSRSKEDFVWFIKTAISDKTSDAYGELFHRMLKIFVGADTNKDGLVSKASFFKLIEGYIPQGTSIYANTTEKEEALEKLFNEMDLKYTGVITFDEWLKFCLEHIGAKAATLEAHPILDHGSKEEFKAFITKAVVPNTPEHTELFWYLLEIFIANDSNKDGNVTEYAFGTMCDKVLSLPMKLSLVKTDEEFYGENLAKKDELRKELFAKYNLRGDGKMSFDEFLAYSMENIFKKMLLDD